LEESNEEAGGGTCHTNADGMRGDADHSLVRAVRSGAVRERNDGKPKQASERNANRQAGNGQPSHGRTASHAR
jgi:hypothetical protein